MKSRQSRPIKYHVIADDSKSLAMQGDTYHQYLYLLEMLFRMKKAWDTDHSLSYIRSTINLIALATKFKYDPTSLTVMMKVDNLSLPALGLQDFRAYNKYRSHYSDGPIDIDQMMSTHAAMKTVIIKNPSTMPASPNHKDMKQRDNIILDSPKAAAKVDPNTGFFSFIKKFFSNSQSV